MLTDILKSFRETSEPLGIDQLSKKLHVDRGVLEGMLQTLVRQEKLREVTIGSVECTHCGSRGHCAALQSNRLGTVYELVENENGGGYDVTN